MMKTFQNLDEPKSQSELKSTKSTSFLAIFLHPRNISSRTVMIRRACPFGTSTSSVFAVRGFVKAFAISAICFMDIVSATVATIPTATWIVVYIVTLAIFLPIVIKASAHGFRTETTCFGAFFKHALLCFWIFAFSQCRPSFARIHSKSIAASQGEKG